MRKRSICIKCLYNRYTEILRIRFSCIFYERQGTEGVIWRCAGSGCTDLVLSRRSTDVPVLLLYDFPALQGMCWVIRYYKASRVFRDLQGNKILDKLSVISGSAG